MTLPETMEDIVEGDGGGEEAIDNHNFYHPQHLNKRDDT